jgi:hypothetical protein
MEKVRGQFRFPSVFFPKEDNSPYCDMRPDSKNKGVRETAIAKQSLCNHATTPEPS